MTLIELLVTIAILGILTVLAVPAFRTFQGRQALLTNQKGMQSLLYRMQQLALAPINTTSNKYDVVGYGLVVLSRPVGASPQVTIGSCSVAATSDVIALVAIAKYNVDGHIDNFLVDAADPDNNGQCNQNPVDPTKYPDTFYVLSPGVQISQNTTPALPWLIVQPLEAVGQDYGSLCGSGQFACTGTKSLNLTDPLVVSPNNTALLRLKYNSLSDPTDHNKLLCREVKFTRDVTISVSGTIVSGGCS